MKWFKKLLARFAEGRKRRFLSEKWLGRTVKFADPDTLALGGIPQTGTVVHVILSGEKPGPSISKHLRIASRQPFAISRLVISTDYGYLVVPEDRWKYLEFFKP